MTHDVKNLLQSLQTLVFATENAGIAEPDEFRALMQRQLPVIASRLATTLENLRAPGQTRDEDFAPADAWWRDARRRYAHLSWVQFHPAELERGITLPGRVASAVLDNVVGNAEQKRASAPDLRLNVTIENGPGARWALRLEDNGAKVPDPVARQLFSRPVRSSAGLGIGLYQAARLAAQHGCALRLADNAPGHVVFELASDAAQDQAG